MKIQSVAGIEFAENGSVVALVLELKWRWWSRKKTSRYIRYVRDTGYGGWRSNEGRPASKEVWRILDEALIDKFSQPVDRHAGYEPRQVSRPSNII